MNILIVDDQKEVREGLSRIFRENDALNHFHVYTYENAAGAYAALLKNKPEKTDVVLLDIAMDGEDGFSLLRRIRDNNINISVIMMTSYPEMDFALQAIEMHVDGFLLKPFSAEKLQEVLLDIDSRNHVVNDSPDIRFHLHCMMLDSYLRGDHTELDFPGLCRKVGIDDFTESDYGVIKIVVPVTDDTENKQQKFFNEINRLFTHIVGYSAIVGQITIIAGVSDVSEFTLEIQNALSRHYMAYSAACAVRSRDIGLQSIYTSACHILKYCDSNSSNILCMDALELRKCFVREYESEIFDSRSNKEQLNVLLSELFDLCMTCRIPLQGIETDLYEHGIGKNKVIAQGKMPTIRFRALLMDNIFVPDENVASGKVDLMVRYMLKHYNEDITLASVANAANINYTYASMLFKQYQKKNFTELLLEIRMNEAQKLILHTNCYVYEIAGKVGITNEKYFIRQFKEFFGVTPQTYRTHAKDGDSSK